MTSLDQIATWAAAGESETQEFKRTTGQRREAARTLCAMLNHRGGRVIFGVEPDGRVVGQQVSDRTVEEIAQEIREIEPPVFPTIERVAAGGGREVLVVAVGPGHSQPYTHRGQAYRRVGTTNQALSREEYNRVLIERLHAESRWEIQPADGWSAADLDEDEIRRTLEEGMRIGRVSEPGTREPEAILRGLGLMKQGVLLRAAVVLFGRADRFLPDYTQCLLRVARFRGTEKGEFLDNRRFFGNAFELLRQAERFLLEHMPIAGRFEPDSMVRIDEPAYSPLAFREAVANAICHREYTSGGRRRDLRRPPRGDFLRHPALRDHAAVALRAPRVPSLEPAHRECLLPARHHRNVGARDAQDGRLGGGVGSSEARDPRDFGCSLGPVPEESDRENDRERLNARENARENHGGDPPPASGRTEPLGG